MAMQSGFIKRIRDIMRMDAGINGDAQRIEQMVWMLFLKVYDAKEDDWELNEDDYESIIPEELRWRNWAKADSNGYAMTGDKLLNFVNNILFPVLKGNDCSLSGIENQCKALLERGEPVEKIARYCIEAIAAVLDKMCGGLLEELGDLPVVFSGGVCSNSLLRRRLGERYHGYFAAPEFSSDNAAGAAVLAWKKRCFS